MSTSIHKQSFSIVDQKTRSVTLYPASAAIVRDVSGVVVKPGVNEYTIDDISNFAREASFRVEGHGTSATITDMSVVLVSAPPNFLLFPHFLDYSSGESDSESQDAQALSAAEDELFKLRTERETLNWNLATVTNSGAAIEEYGRNLCGNRNTQKGDAPVALEWIMKYLETYAASRDRSVVLQDEIQIKIRELQKKITALEKKLGKLKKRVEKEKEKKRAEHEKKKKPEAVTRYPYYRLKVTVEAETLPPDAPSVVAKIDTGKPKHLDDGSPPPDATGPSLRISYLVHNAGWSPKYELRFDTIARNGTLGFRAEATNNTTETWEDSQVTLSTVQTKYSMVSENIPQLDQWKIGLGKRDPETANAYSLSERQAFGPPVELSFFERQRRRTRAQQAAQAAQAAQVAQAPFPPPPSSFQTFQVFSPPPLGAARVGNLSGGGLFGPQPAVGAAAFGATSGTTPGSLFGQKSTTAFSCAAPQQLFGAPQQLFGAPATEPSVTFPNPEDWAPTHLPLPRPSGAAATSPGYSPASLNYSPTSPDSPSSSSSGYSGPKANALPFQAGAKMALSTSTSQTYGITTTFSLPGTKTLPSSATPLRYMVSETAFENVELTYSIVPKLALAAYLTAAIALPAGAPPFPSKTKAGLSVDGTFVGNIDVPEPEDGKFFLCLGADEALEVTYDKPGRKSEVRGLLRKEETVTFTRAWTVRNRRAQAVKVVVRDQIPVVDTEAAQKLRLTVKKPEMETEKGAVRLKEGGEVEWRLTLAPGEKRRGELEWEIVMEKGEEGIVSLT